MSAAPLQPPPDLPLAGLFDPAEPAQWHRLVASALVKAGRMTPDDDPAQAVSRLTSTTYDGIGIRPLYTRDDAVAEDAIGVPGLAPFVRGSRAAGTVPYGWDIRQRHLDPDPEVTHEAVMADLENGVTSLWLTLGQGGLPLGSLSQVLNGVLLDLAPVVLDAGADTEAAAEEFLTLLDGIAGAGGNLGADPIGLRARLGAGHTPDLALLPRLAERATGTALRVATVDATVYHDAGASDAQELGASLATGVAYLRALTEAGIGTADAFAQLEFRYAANADQFLTIAKLRAARRLWARVAEVCGLEEQLGDPASANRLGQRQHVVTSSAMMSRRDPWVNLLRTTLAAFGAGVGGADSVTVQPFDAAIGLPDAFSRRIARNTSSLLVMESHLARVIDPAGGSWYVEQITEELARAAWEQFTSIEAEGGMAAALGTGRLAAEIDQVWQRRAKRLAHRKDPLTGVSEFPNLSEPTLVRKPLPEKPHGGLPVHRYAEEYEALRDSAEAQTGAPEVFLVTIGPVAVHTARATFAANLFQAGGLQTPSGDVEAFRASGATIACLASSDKVYAEQAQAVAEALKEAGAQHVLLAGKPGEYPAVDDYVFMGVDALAVLRDLHRRIGIGS
ncbi:methylmalonyl-CoA mutase subunit beta [Kineosporia rhizophila]|uniref:methylmalonyl-CoA mutase subunit beta n=1 Tax=Kineosporia TaxID=49184 RepID=UPI001E330AB5|nr:MULTISPECIES: methylmalonyl-CoA mutase subunit beta [Kineosporia]MCE0539666.1 methylmalonyl-CoA mutase subunit beta [Kineosporia rhizophila]GLY17906.1 methylmalonyl-CoA mutase [Kineosporia sp. NBRC 101677]